MKAPDSVKLLPIVNGHLPLVAERLARACVVCRASIDDSEPMCERCGLRAFHFECYRARIAHEQQERKWWTSELSEMTEEEDIHVIVVCPGCRS